MTMDTWTIFIVSSCTIAPGSCRRPELEQDAVQAVTHARSPAMSDPNRAIAQKAE